MHERTRVTGCRLLLGAAVASLVLGGVASAADTGSGITRDVGAIAVIEHDGSNYDRNAPDGRPHYAARAPVAQRFYETHGDLYDFLVVFTNFAFDTGEAQAFHVLVRSDVRGLGRPLADQGTLFGSPSRLKGYVDMADVGRWRRADGAYSLTPGEPGFQATLNVLAHEIAHQWLAEPRYVDAAGQLSADLLGLDGVHWSYLLDSDASVLHGSDWHSVAPGRYVARRTSAAYSSLDLYLMGLLDPGRVAPLTLLRNPAVDPAGVPVIDAEVEAAAETVTIEQIVAANGPRIPDHRASQKDFRIGFIFLTRPGIDPDPADLAAVDAVRQRFAAHFFALTRGVAIADTVLAEADVGAPSAPPQPDLDRALSWLVATRTAEGAWQDTPRTAVRDTAAVVEALAARDMAPATMPALAWLGGVQPRAHDFAARRASALAARASPLTRAALRQELLSGQNADGGFGFAAGFASDALDTALALRALSRLPAVPPASVGRAIAAISRLRLSGGGWPLVPGGETSSVATAEVVLALQDWAGHADAQALLGGGLSALLARRNGDGGFGEGPSTAYATALALQVLLRADAPADVIAGATDWLQRDQRADGSWAGSVYETALVLGAMGASTRPNLVVRAGDLSVEPPSPVAEGGVLTVRARVRNVGRRASDPALARLQDGVAVLAEAAVPALDPGGEAAVSFELATDGHTGTRTLYVAADPEGTVSESREDDNTGSIVVTVNGRLPDLALGPEAIVVRPYPPEDGETVEVAVRVWNAGDKGAPASTLRVVRGDPRAGGTVMGMATVAPLPAGQASVVTLPWDTTGLAGDHVLHAIADPAYALLESDERNNEAALPVRIASVAPSEPELELAAVTLDPPALQALPTTVQVRATVRNLGRTPATTTAALSVGSLAAGEVPITIGPRSAVTVSFAFEVTAAGQRTVTVRADPANALAEPDETNNVATAVLLDPGNTLDLVLLPEDLHVPDEVTAGEVLTVHAIARNRGTAPIVAVPITLSADGAELTRTAVTLAPGQHGPVTLTWQTVAAGDLSLRLAGDPFGLLAELSEDDNEVSFAVRVVPSTRPNLRVSGDALRFEPDPPREGGAAVVSATVRNTGTVPAGPFAVRFFRGDPDLGGVPIGQSEVAGLAGSEEVVAAATWSRVDVRGAHGVVAVVDMADAVAEYDESDNRAFRPFSVLSGPDLVVTTADLTLSPRYPRSGEALAITVRVGNAGQQSAAAATLRLRAGEPGAETDVASATVPSLEPGEFVSMPLVWGSVGAAGEKAIHVTVDAAGDVSEADEGNNDARLRALVQDADLFLSEVYFSPDGDGRRDDTLVGFRAPRPVTVQVFDRDGRHVRTLAAEPAREGTLPWRGDDDAGRLLPDGRYTVTAVTEDGAALSRTHAFLDANREPIHDAAGTGMLSVHAVRCRVRGIVSGPAFLPGEDEMLFLVSDRFGETGVAAGIVRVGLGGDYSYVTSDPWYAGEAWFADKGAVSPDGREVLIWNDGLFAVDLLTGDRRRLAEGIDASAANWSPDGRYVATRDRVLSRDGTLVATLPNLNSFRPPAWSPDGLRLAVGGVVMNRDGSTVREIDIMHLPAEAAYQYTVFETTWRGDGKVVAWAGRCGDGCGEGRVYLIDPDMETAEELRWLRAEPGQPYRYPIGWSPDGRRLLHGLYGGESVSGGTSLVSGADGVDPVRLAPEIATLSPRGSAITYYAPPRPDAGCVGSGELVGVSLQNLTVGLDAIRLAGANGIVVKGTASDRHLAFYQLEYAPAADPEDWRPIGPASEVPAVDQVLTVWVPPAPGAYRLRLRTEDRAGNRRSRILLVAWDRLPRLANLTLSDTVLSPNGDGAKDAVTVRYLVVDPAQVEVRVNGPAHHAGDGPVVRRVALEHAAVGPAAFSWDGRDDAGVVVPDGRYTLTVNGLPFHVTVDATPPDIAWSYESVRVEEGRLVADRIWRVVDPGLRSWLVPGWFADREQAYEPLRDGTGAIQYRDGVARMLVNGGRPVSRRDRVPAQVVAPAQHEVHGLGTDAAATLVAEDQAGNRSVAALLPVAEALFLLQAEGRPGPFKAGEVVRLPPRTVFTVAETIRDTPAEGESVRFQYRPGGSGSWTAAVPFAVHGEGSWQVDFEALGLELGADYEGRFVATGRGRELGTEPFLFRPCTESFRLGVQLLSAVARAQWRVTLAADVAEPLLSATLTVTGHGALAGYRTTVPFELGRENVVSTPPPTCATDPAGLLAFELKVLGASGRSYEHDRQCRRLKWMSALCSSVQVEQQFGYCAGDPDVLSLAVTTTSPVAATATIDRGPEGSATRVARFDVPPSLDTSFGTVVSEDVSAVPEGGVPLRGELTTADGVKMAATAVTAVVDRTPPAVDIVEPVEGGLLCVTSDPVSGRDVARLAFQVHDAGARAEFAHAEVESLDGPFVGQRRALVRACAAPEAASSVAAACGNGADDPGFPSVFTGARADLGWDVTGLPEGAYAVTATACDRSGNRASARRRVSLVRAQAGADVLDVAPRAFSPNGDGIADTVAIRLRLPQAAVVNVNVEGHRRLRVGETLHAGEHTVTWDGRRDDGSVAPEGRHQVVVETVDGCGRPARTRAEIVLDLTPPTATIVTPSGGQRAGVAVEVRGVATDAHFDSYALSAGAGEAPSSFSAAGAVAVAREVRPSDPPGLLGHWDTPRVPGPYTLRLVARDAAGNEAEARVLVQVDGRARLGQYRATPVVFSPNGDGRRDAATIEYELLSPAAVGLEITTTAGSVRTLRSSNLQDAGLHALVWDGTDAAGTPMPDGEYHVRLEVRGDGGAEEAASVALLLDRSPPTVSVTYPVAGGFATKDQAVLGAVADPLLTRYTIAAFPASTDDPVELAGGPRMPEDGRLATLAPLPDGRYTLLVRAEDAGENRTVVDVPFVVDAIPPAVSIVEPPPGAVLDGGAGSATIVGTATDANLREYTLAFGAGPAPAVFAPIASGSAAGRVGAPLGTWSLAGVPDGDYTLRLDAIDHAGLRTEAFRTVTVDTAVPIAHLTSPGEGAVVNDLTVDGTADDAHLDRWTVEVAPGLAASAHRWTVLHAGTAAIRGGRLATSDGPLAEGEHTLRLTVTDRAGHVAMALRTVTIDRTPPSAPKGLGFEIASSGDGSDVRLAWRPSEESDVAGYRVFRDGAELTAKAIAEPRFEDPDRPEGRARYAVEAVDRAGNRSIPARVEVMLDATPPIVAVTWPTPGIVVGGVIEVRGSAFSAGDFREYRLTIGESGDPAGSTLLRRSSVPVAGGVLGSWTATGAGPRMLVLEAEDLSGNRARVSVPLSVDDEAPNPPVLLAVDPAGEPSALTATWSPSTSTDVTGYVVYRNGRVANAPDVATATPVTFAVSGPTYSDALLGDGRHCYRVAAVDAAANVSPLSNEVCRTLDDRAPAAAIVAPAAGTRFDDVLPVVAASRDTDLAGVQLEYRAEGTAAWQRAGTRHQPPFEWALDPAALSLAPGAFELRAVATDEGGRTDSAPSSVIVVHADVTPPPAPEALAAHVDGADVALSWAAPAAGTAGHHVYRDGARRTDEPVSLLTWLDAGREPGLYEYEITALDESGNESARSSTVSALVYRVSVDPPAFPVTEAPATIVSGAGALAGSTVELLRDGVPIAEVTAAGRFELTAPLLDGPNQLQARAIDEAGNRSLPSAEVVLIANRPPPAVTGLQAVVEGHVVDLRWDTVDDPEQRGYRITRGATALTPSRLEDHAAEPGASGEWNVVLARALLVEGIRLAFRGGEASDHSVVVPTYVVEAAWQDRYVPIARADGQDRAEVEHHLPSAFETSAVRIVIGPGAAVPVTRVDVRISVLDLRAPDATTWRDHAGDGTFEYRVAAVDRYGGVGAPASLTAAVGDVAAPAPPTGLVATVAGSDVALSWTPPADADVVGYRVVRDGAAIASSAAAGHRDAGLPNGRYAYRVHAVDGAGNQSEPSDEAVAIVAVTLAVPPVLAGVAGPHGEARLTWEHPGAADFSVERRPAAGAFVEIARTGGLRAYEDRVLAVGTTSLYVVRAWDAHGNASPASNVVAVTHTRTAPVIPPVIDDPTDAAHPITLHATRTRVAGRAPSDSLVLLERNGRLAAMGPSRPAWVENESVVLPAAWDVALSADGRVVAYTDGDSPPFRLFVRDRTSGATSAVQMEGGPSLFAPTLSPDGGLLAFLAQPADGSGSDAFVLHLADGRLTALDDGPERSMALAWAPDGESVAIVRMSEEWPFEVALVVRDLQWEAVTPIATGTWGDFLDVTWSPDGGRLAYSRQGWVRVRVLSTGVETTVGQGSSPAWSPDGRRLAYVRPGAPASRVVLYTLESGETADVTDGEFRAAAPAFDPSGTRLSYMREVPLPLGEVRHEAMVHVLSSGVEERLETSEGESALGLEPPTWSSDGRLVVAFPAVPRLTWYQREEGFFALDEVALDAGDNLLTARALDLASGLESADSEPVQVMVPDALFADLVAAPPSLHPAAAVKGHPLVVTARVENAGAAAVEGVRARFVIVDPSLAVVAEQEATVSRLEAGAAASVALEWTPSSAGPHLVRFKVEATDGRAEQRSDNNETTRRIEVLSAAGLGLRLTLDRAAYAARAPVRVEVVVANAGPAFTGDARLTVVDAAGREAAVVDVRPLALPFGGESRYVLTWNTARTYAGEYAMRLAVRDADAATHAAAERTFRISPEIAVTARLRAERAVVTPPGEAVFTAQVANASANAALTDAVVRFRVQSATESDVPVFEALRPLPTLLPGATWDAGFTWPAAAAPGRYRAVLAIAAEGAVLAEAEALMEVAPGPTLAGTLALDPPHVLAGAPVQARVTLTNLGTAPVLSAPVVVEIRDGALAAVLASTNGQVDVPASGTASLVVPVVPPAAGIYPVLLRLGGADAPAARATLYVHGPIVAPAVDAPADGARVGTAHPELRVSNAFAPGGLPLRYEFELYADAALTLALRGESLEETPGRTGWRVPWRLAEDARYYWRARATDSFASSAWTEVASFLVDERNEPPFAPIPDGPSPDQRVPTREPTLVVRNALDPERDPLTYEFRIARDPTFEALVASAAGVTPGVVFSAWRVPAPLEENGQYHWAARAWDGTSHSPWSAPLSFRVDTSNEPPSAPVLVWPAAGALVPTLSPELVAAGASDPEAFPLAYRFELDVVPSFDSPGRQVSPDVPAGPGQAAWTPPLPLQEDVRYYWRAAAFDGTVVGPWTSSTFVVSVVNAVPSVPLLLDPADLQTVTTMKPALRVRNATDPEGDALSYEFEVRDDVGSLVAAADGIGEGTSHTDWTVPVPLAENGTFRWRARAHDAVAAGAWAEFWRFRVSVVHDPPTAPSLLAPLEGAILDDSYAVLSVRNASSPEGLFLTYTFELYRLEPDGDLALVAAVASLPEGDGSTAWEPAAALADGTYVWRVRADDGHQAGPWMPSARFTVHADAPPAPPAGLAAVAGDGEVALAWTPSAEPDVIAYRVHRGQTSGGPYEPVAQVAAPEFLDRGRANGVTQFYVVTAIDGRVESAYSLEVTATPQPRTIAAHVVLRPASVPGECLLAADRDECPRWLYGTIALGVVDAAVIAPESVRLAGSVRPDPAYDRLLDADGNGIAERELRFRFGDVVPGLRVGARVLHLTGRTATAEFAGAATVTVQELFTDLRVTPRTLNRRSHGEYVQAQLTFAPGIPAAAVAVAGLRLNGVVPAVAVVTAQRERLVLKFDRAAVAAVLPPGDAVPVRVTGEIAGVPFVARDFLRVHP